MATSAPVKGDPAPAFTLPDANGHPVSLSDYAGKPVIVFFYPAAATQGCTTEACDFTAARPALDAAGYTVLGISPDQPEKLAAWTKSAGLDLVLLSDPDRTVIDAYGAYGEKLSYGKPITGVIRSTFVVDPDGSIGQAWRNVRATGHVGRVLSAIGVG